MKDFTDFFSNNDKNQDFLRKITDPLKITFGIDVFWHSTLHESGQFSCLCNYYDAFGHFWENRCYEDMGFYISPSRSKSGYYFLDHDADYTKYMDNINGNFPLYHPFLIIRKDGKNKAHLFGFGSKHYTPALPSLYVNSLSILNSYADYYLNSLTTQNTVIDLAKIRGHDAFYGKSYGENSLPQPEHVSPFLQQMGIRKELLHAAKKLSVREKEVLIAYLERKSAVQSGQELDLSPRTVQFYIENIKNKLGILSRKELLEIGGLLKMTGYLHSPSKRLI